MVKTDYLNYYTSFQHGLQLSKWTLRPSTSPLHAFGWSKRTLRPSTSLLHIFRWLKQTVRTSTSLMDALLWSKQTLQTRDYKPPIRFAVVKRQSKLLRASCTLCGGRMDSPNLYKLPTRCAGDKTYFPDFYKLPSRYGVVKTDSEFLQASYIQASDTAFGG